jgi:cellulose synthase (UDP-forming)
VVRFTALAAMNIDWPAEKLNVYILDDGRREEFRTFAEEAGIGYMTRDDNQHAKAGNINHALERLNSQYIAVFDSDHVPTRSFLQVTMGWFLRDQRLGVLQTPHHFYSPDPFERNLDQFRVIPNEGELFYGIVQDGNDFWNATFFCGSCAVLRRSALDEVGGVAVETVTEDAHTSLRMQMDGWNTAYINIPQAAGLATERLSAHVRQRIRWARGMVQVLRIENPLFAPGLKPAQRLCYFNAMSHFLYALPRLIFLTAPLIYLIFGYTNIPGYWVAILAYAVPHLFLSNLTNSRVQGQHRHSFWNEIYETVLAPYIFLPTLFALISPKLGRFTVTAKGGVVTEEFFDTRIARPFLLLLAMNLFGLLCAIPRFFQFPTWDVPWWLSFVNWPANIYSGDRPGTIWMNVLWTLFNVTILGVATAVAWETQQRRQTVRVAMAVPSDVILPDGSMVQGVTSDLSSGGVRAKVNERVKAEVGDPVKFVFPVLDGTATLPATIIGKDATMLRAQFDPLTLREEEALTMILYSHADTWLGWGEGREADRPLRSMGRIVRISLHGLWQTLRGFGSEKKKEPKGRLATSVAPMVLLAMLAGITTRDARAGVVAPEGTFDDAFSLADAGVPQVIVLRGVDASHTIYFSVPRNELVKTATLRLRYHFAPGLPAGTSGLKVSLNGTLFATVPADAESSATLLLPADLLVRDNQLTFEFVGRTGARCEDVTNPALWGSVDASSTVELVGSLLALPNDLKLLPLPFYDGAVNVHPVVPIVFLSPPKEGSMRAAGIIASWFGMLADYRAMRFPVSFGAIPAGSNAIVIGEDASAIPASLRVTDVSGPTIAMRDNPSNSAYKVLVVTGANADDLVKAAMGLALERDVFAGDTVRVPDVQMPGPRRPDDAPRWLSTEKPTTIGEIAQTGDLQGDGSVPVGVYMRIPPDLYFGERQNLALHLSYRYDGIPPANDSSLQVYVNSAYVSSTPMPHTDKASTELDAVVPIPVGDMRPFSNSMMLKFVFQAAKSGRCADAAPMDMQGTILKDSYLDISDIPHWAALPNLELFANAGFPFTRKADLADTAVVLPDVPTSEEVEMFLTMMGHFGAQTGYPVLNVSVTNAAGMTSESGKDYLVMGTVADQPALKTLGDSLPVGVDEGGLHIRDTQGFFDRVESAWRRLHGAGRVGAGELDTAGGVPDALVEGLEWPKGSNRSVVLVVLRDPTGIAGFLSAFLKASQSSDIAQSVGVLRGGSFASYRIGDDEYRVGEASLLTRVTMGLQQYSWLIVIVAVGICFLMAALFEAMLGERARVRLQGNS